MGGRSLCVQISRERSNPLPIYWYHSKGNWLRYNFAADSFYIMKLCSRRFVLYCRNCMKDDKFSYLIPILRKLGAAVNLGWCLVGKPVYDFLFVIIELFFAISCRWDATRQNVSTLSKKNIKRGRSVWAKISGGTGCPWGIFFGF